MGRIAKKKKVAKKKAVKKTTTKKVAKKKKAKTNDDGGFSMKWGKQFDWFKKEAKRFGMSATNLVKRAVKEFSDRYPPEDCNDEENRQ